MSTFDETLAMLRAADASLAQTLVHPDQLTIEPDSLVVGDSRYPLTEIGLESLCNHFAHQPKVPADYLRSIPAELQTGALRYHLTQGMKGDGQVALFTRDNQLVAIGRSDLASLNGVNVLEAALEGTGGRVDDLEITQAKIDDASILLDLIVQRASHDVRPGDTLTAGVRLRHSQTGAYATQVEGYVIRLLCANGMTQRECTGTREVARTRRLPANHPHAKHQQRKQITNLVSDAIANIQRRFSALDQLTSERVEFNHFATHWLRRSRLSPQRLLPLLRQAHEVEGGEDSAYGVFIAFTRVATHQTDLSLNIRNVLARLGGMLAFGHSRMCPRCWSLIASSN